MARLLWSIGTLAILLTSGSARGQAAEPPENSGAGAIGGGGAPRAARPRGAERLPSAADRSRYRDVADLVRRNLHRGPHFTKAVDVGTVNAVRRTLSERDVPILVAMLSDRDPVAASAAQDLLVICGMKAVGALLAVRRNDAYAAPGATLALRSIRDCYSIALWDRRNPDLCPEDRTEHRGKEVPTELSP